MQLTALQTQDRHDLRVHFLILEASQHSHTPSLLDYYATYCTSDQRSPREPVHFPECYQLTTAAPDQGRMKARQNGVCVTSYNAED